MKKIVILRNATLFFILLIVISGCIQRPCTFESLRGKNLEYDLAVLYAGLDTNKMTLSLDDMIDIAVKRNLDIMVKCQQVMIQKETATQEKLRMLPSIIVNYENYGRDRNTATFSESLIPGVPPAPLSISSETHVERVNINLTWNLLDFGLSYLKSKQEVNRALMEQLEYERLKQNIILNITKNYWKAVSAILSIKSAEDTLERTESLKDRIEKQVKARYLSKVRAYLTKHDLINVKVGMKAVERDLHQAKCELSQLMGLPPMIDFDIILPDLNLAPKVTCNVEELEIMALTYRPELFRQDFEEKVMIEEIKISLLQMIPGIELFTGPYYDSNRFLLNNNWNSIGLRATWDLLRIPYRFKSANVAERRKSLAKKTRLTLSMGVMAQVHLAYLLYRDYLEQYEITKELHEVNQNLLKAARQELKWGKLDSANISEYEIQALLAEVNMYRTYGDLQTALEQISNAMGLPRYFNNLKEENATCQVLNVE